jgi:hypothetical protein
MKQLLRGNSLVPALGGVKKFNPKKVDYALSFNLSSENVSYTHGKLPGCSQMVKNTFFPQPQGRKLDLSCTGITA